MTLIKIIASQQGFQDGQNAPKNGTRKRIWKEQVEKTSWTEGRVTPNLSKYPYLRRCRCGCGYSSCTIGGDVVC